jgi:predicted  nucleic acid-binding Zn-ribbon protein
MAKLICASCGEVEADDEDNGIITVCPECGDQDLVYPENSEE